MQAIILAAGMGRRLQAFTKSNTKFMVKVNGITLAERLLKMLDKKGLSRIVLVVGYEGQKLIDYIGTLNIHTPIEFISNPIYDKTNNIYSLSLADEYLISEDTLLFESDLIFEESCIDELLNDERPTLALVDKYASWMDGTCMVLADDDSIVDFIPGKYLNFDDKDRYYKTVNIYKLSKDFSENTYVPFLEAYRKSMGENEYYESVIKLIAMLGSDKIKGKRLEGQKWYEIDDVQDLNIAESLFPLSEADCYRQIMSRFGGFWRYPKMMDFCYLVNPYYPPKRMKNEMKSNFDMLLCDYPSGMEVNSLIASRNFNISANNIVVGNGAAELIKALMESKDWGKLGLVRPTFEEYPHRYSDASVVSYTPNNDDFAYDESDLIQYFEDKQIDTLLIINPDNPSGNYINKEGIYKLISWSKAHNIALIIDESFVDFSDEINATIVTERDLGLYENLYVMKSISKSYGVPGLRLGILASSDRNMIAKLKKEMAIWNVNSYGEFFMQIYEKYEKSYVESLVEVRKRREELFDGLSGISYLRPIRSQANYIMCEVVDRNNTITSKLLCEKMLTQNILIKDLSGKLSGKQYIRIAVRKKEENEILLHALHLYD